jgi:hypothetical protein
LRVRQWFALQEDNIALLLTLAPAVKNALHKTLFFIFSKPIFLFSGQPAAGERG